MIHSSTLDVWTNHVGIESAFPGSLIRVSSSPARTIPVSTAAAALTALPAEVSRRVDVLVDPSSSATVFVVVVVPLPALALAQPRLGVVRPVVDAAHATLRAGLIVAVIVAAGMRESRSSSPLSGSPSPSLLW